MVLWAFRTRADNARGLGTRSAIRGTPNAIMNTLEREAERIRKFTAKLIERGKDTCERLEERAAAAARRTNKVIRKHPYEAIGVGVGLGLLIGVLIKRSRKD